MLGGPQGAREFDLRQVVGIQGGNQVVVGHGNRSLGLHNLNGVGDSGREAVLGLRQGLIREVEIAPGDCYLVGGRLDVKQSRPDLIIDLAAKIGQLILTLLQCRPGLNDVAADSATVENIEFRESLKRERSVGTVERRSDIAVIRGNAQVRVALGREQH